MTPRMILTTSAAAIALTAGSAQADLTGAQVWDDWKSYMRGFGYDMTGTESQSGDTLTVNDVAMTFVIPEDGGEVSMQMGALAFIDNAGGSVSIELPAEMPMKFDMTPKGGDAASFTLLYKQAQPNMVVSGDPNDMTYTYTADSASMIMDSFVVEGVTLPADMMSVSFDMNNISNVTRMTIANLRSYAQTMTADSLQYNMTVNPPETDGGGSFSYAGQIDGLDARAIGDIPLEISSKQMADMNAMLDQGFNFEGAFVYSGGAGQFSGESPDGAVSGATSSTGGTFEIAMGPAGLSYDVEQNNTKVDMQIPQFPLPISLEMVKSAFNLTMPIKSGDEEQDFAFGFTMGEFTISDAIWGIFDPTSQLPRDPATLMLDLTGKAKILANIFDPAQAAQLQTGASMGELNTLSLNGLEISAVGAQVTGQGAFTFDNSDLVTFGGVPRPAGGVNLRVQGANTLIDTLVNMGFVQQEQAMGARMMMGLFGVPQGDDTLTSRVEINDQGHVLANGQRIR